jgi:hypothetical protein
LGAKTTIEWTDAIRARLAYNPHTGLLTWKNGRCEGGIAGKREHHGYVQIVIKGKACMAHRLAWFLMIGEWPSSEMDIRNNLHDRLAAMRVKLGLGVLFLLFGAALLKVALDLVDAPKNPIWLLVLAWGVGCVAGVLICQGTFLVLTGNWLP